MLHSHALRIDTLREMNALSIPTSSPLQHTLRKMMMSLLGRRRIPVRRESATTKATAQMAVS